jgi:hypothetical protein
MDRMEFSTTAEQEVSLTHLYEKLIHEKQKRLDSKDLPSKPQKYTAYAFVSLPPRIFSVVDGFIQYPTSIPPTGGKVYRLDPDCIDSCIEFIKHNPSYDVHFYPSGFFGPTIDYCCPHKSTPALLKSKTSNQSLKVHVESKYSVGCL